jgi:GTP pyrophosphokinase
MRAISMDSENKSFDGTVRVYVNDLEHLDFLISKLKNIKGIHSVSRSDS